MKKILFVSSEIYPLIKTGGLADVSSSLPKALANLSQDVRLIIPNYQTLRLQHDKRYLCSLRVNNLNVNILETQLPDSHIPVWLVDCPEFFDHPGNPYVDHSGQPWFNNAERFALFCRIAVEMAMDRANQNWRADIVHCNDWQSGLVPALLSLEFNRPSTVFTIHNLAYQGLFSAQTMQSLNLPGQLWHADGLEFHGMLSFIKGGIAYCDHITTVSPTYALEIQTPTFGYGLEGLLYYRSKHLTGIINGIDPQEWNPQSDHYLPHHYNASDLSGKAANKALLQQRMGLPVDDQILLFGLISRLVEQKGIDLVISSLSEMASTMPMQLVLLGAGDREYEQRLHNLASRYPDKIAISIGYNEELAHLIEAGADCFLMPSRFEPCGLNQMYSQRYGTIPIVRGTGGLADTVIDAMPDTLAQGTATGVIFGEACAGGFLEASKRALLLFNQKNLWQQMQRTAMEKDFSWQRSAEKYLALYGEM